jgi:hypothetical protein
MSPTTDPGVDSYATTPGVLYVRVTPSDKPVSFTLFDGAVVGIGAAGVQGFSMQYGDGAEFRQGAVFEIVAAQKGFRPVSVSVDDVGVPQYASLAELEGHASGWAAVDEDSATRFYVKVPGGVHEVGVSSGLIP